VCRYRLRNKERRNIIQTNAIEDVILSLIIVSTTSAGSDDIATLPFIKASRFFARNIPSYTSTVDSPPENKEQTIAE
jgi:hypothetical protein